MARLPLPAAAAHLPFPTAAAVTASSTAVESSRCSRTSDDRSSSGASSSGGDVSSDLKRTNDEAGATTTTSEVCLAQIQYDMDILGLKGPRNMSILLARPEVNVYEVLKSKKAAWDRQLKSFVLDFHGRASQVESKDDWYQ